VDSFTKLEQVGQGAFGTVWKAVDRESNDVVALKRVRMENEREGFPITALREMKIMSTMNHENIVKLKEIVASRVSADTLNKGSVFMVFEYCPVDLTGLLECKSVKLRETHVMCIMKQILTGLHYAHLNGVLHRDIKLPNILISAQGIVKLADWGLGRPYRGDGGKYTNRVVTLWYRAPELLLGETKYSSAIDLWSVGCVFAELMASVPVFPGKDEGSQLKMIFELCGHPSATSWPEWTSLPLAWLLAVPASAAEPQLSTRFAWMRPAALALLCRLLDCNPASRISAMDALDAEWFWLDSPRPCLPGELPLPLDDIHEFEVKERKRAKAATTGLEQR